MAVVPDSPVEITAYHWLPVLLLEPGMVVARPVVGTTSARATLLLGIGTILSTDTIAQLINRGVECVAIAKEEDAPQSEAALTQYRDRLNAIFGPEPDPACQKLRDALLRAEGGSC